MLTIRDVLQLPIFADAKLVAGEGGLDKEIRWVHIVSLPATKWYEWTKGGELVLTVGFGFRDNEEKLQQLIQQLVEARIVGLVLSIGHYFTETPTILIDEANRLDFPLIEVPGDLPFIEITEAIFTRIVNEQYALLQRSQEIHRALMDVVLNGGSLQDLARALASVLGQSITIESSAFRLLASAQRGEIDAARERTLAQGQTTPEIIQYLRKTGLQQQLIRDKAPIKIFPQPDYGLDIERIVAPIIVAQSLLGYMWIIADETHLSDLDVLAVEQAATVAALLLYKEKAVKESQRAMRGDFFSQLLQAHKYSKSELESQAEIFDFRMNRNYQVIVIETDGDSGYLASSIEMILEDDTPALITVREKRVVIVLQAHQAPEGKRIASLLFEVLSPDGHNYLIATGAGVDTIDRIANSYEQALEALEIATDTQEEKGVFAFDELGLMHWIQQLPAGVLHANAYYRAVCDLDVHDSQLCETLEAFLDFGGSMKDAADKLYIHRNTLTYRLDRIEEITGLDLRQTNNQINLYVAIKTYRLKENPPR